MRFLSVVAQPNNARGGQNLTSAICSIFRVDVRLRMKTVNRSRAVAGFSRRNARTVRMRGRSNSSTVTNPTDESRAISASALSRTTAISRARLSSARGTPDGVTVLVASPPSGARPHAVPIAMNPARSHAVAIGETLTRTA